MRRVLLFLKRRFLYILTSSDTFAAVYVCTIISYHIIIISYRRS